MNLTLDGHKLIQIFLGCLILASIPPLLFIYLSALVWLMSFLLLFVSLILSGSLHGENALGYS